MKTIEGKCRTVSDSSIHADLICGALVMGVLLIWMGVFTV